MVARRNTLTTATKLRILEEFRIHGYKPTLIAKVLNEKERGYQVSRGSVADVINKWHETGSIGRKIGSGRPSEIKKPWFLSYVQSEMRAKDTTTGKKLWEGVAKVVTLRSCINARLFLNWRSRRTQYGQAVRPANRLKRLEFGVKLWNEIKYRNYKFDDCIFADETQVLLNKNPPNCCRQPGQPPVKQPVYKHAISVMVWAAFGKRGKSRIQISKGIMYREHYTATLKDFLLPFIKEAYPNGGHRFWQNNDPKHCSKTARQFMEDNDINWVRTPAESPDMNPIENVWDALKDWLL